MFSQPPSKSYLDSQMKNVPRQIEICNRVAIEASKESLDPILLIAISFNETKFKNVKSSKGAVGPLGVIPKWHCPKNRKCNYIKAGLRAFKKAQNLSGGDVCKTLAIYNRGPEGRCAEGRSEYSYAQYILDMYDRLCAATDHCIGC